MENKRLSCLTVCRKTILTEKGSRKRQLEKVVKLLEKSKRFVMANVDPSIEFWNANWTPQCIMLPFPLISIEAVNCGDGLLPNAAEAILTLARQISENEISVYLFAKFEKGLGWKHAYIDLRIKLNENGRFDIGNYHTVNVDLSTLPPDAVEQIDALCNIASVEVLALIYFFEQYPEQIEFKQPVREKALGKSGKPLKIDSYHSLVLPLIKTVQTEPAVGSHNSPRAHDRRGFWRTSKYGVRHWVNATIVNPLAENKIEKDYVLPNISTINAE